MRADRQKASFFVLSYVVYVIRTYIHSVGVQVLRWCMAYFGGLLLDCWKQARQVCDGRFLLWLCFHVLVGDELLSAIPWQCTFICVCKGQVHPVDATC